VGQKHKKVPELRTPFFPRYSRKHLRSMYARVLDACAAWDGANCSKNRKIIPAHGDSPNTEIARAYGLRPRLWLLTKINKLE